MVVKKTIGYIIALLGVLLIAIYSIPPLKEALQLTNITDNSLLITGLALTIIGLAVVYAHGSATKNLEEVPIYHGKSVVGYRRHKKK